MVKPVVGRSLEECLPLGDNGEVEDCIPDFRIPAAVFDKVGFLAEGKEVREVLNIIEEGSHIFKGTFEFSLNQDSYAIAISSGRYLNVSIIVFLLKGIPFSKVIVMIHIGEQTFDMGEYLSIEGDKSKAALFQKFFI